MTKRACDSIMPMLTSYLTEGVELPPEAMAHVRNCSECRDTLKRAQLLSELLGQSDPGATPQAVAPMSPVLTTEVASAAKRRRVLRVVLGAMVVVIAAAAWYVTMLMKARHPVIGWTALMILFAGPLVLAAMSAGIDDSAPSPLYKRMRGRQLSGICQGIAEASRIPVWVVRMAFFVLIFLKGAGLILYLLLDVLLPIHPDDRPELLRFRLARWWKSRRASGRAIPA